MSIYHGTSIRLVEAVNKGVFFIKRKGTVNLGEKLVELMFLNNAIRRIVYDLVCSTLPLPDNYKFAQVRGQPGQMCYLIPGQYKLSKIALAPETCRSWVDRLLKKNLVLKLI